MLVVLDLLVASFKAKHGLVVELGRDVLDRLEDKAIALGFFDQRANVLHLPAYVARKVRVVHLHTGHAGLRGKAQFLFGQFLELPDRQPDAHLAASSLPIGSSGSGRCRLTMRVPSSCGVAHQRAALART